MKTQLPEPTQSTAMKTYCPRPLALLLFFSGLVARSLARWGVVAVAMGCPLVGSAAEDPASGLDRYTVRNTADEGRGSLREALEAWPGGEPFDRSTIVFSTKLKGQTIRLSRPIKMITGGARTRMILGPGPANLTIDCSLGGISLDAIETNQVVLIAGLTLTNNRIFTEEKKLSGFNSAIYSSARSPWGETILYSPGDLIVSNCTISGFSAEFGGGIRTFGGTLTVVNSILSGNKALNGGGGIFSFNSQVTIDSCALFGNSAGMVGGGICNSNGSLTIRDCSIDGNTVPFKGPASSDYSEGGGIYNSGGPLVIERSLLRDNSAGGDEFFHLKGEGGGIRNIGAPLTIESSTFSGNWASIRSSDVTHFRYGQSISSTNGAVVVERTTISANKMGSNEGSLLATFNGSLRVRNSVLDSHAPTLVNSGTVGIYTDHSLTGTTLIENCTFNPCGIRFEFPPRYIPLADPRREPVLTLITIRNCTILATVEPYGITRRDSYYRCWVANSILEGAPLADLPVMTYESCLFDTSSRVLNQNLAFNGGPTRTHALVAGSPALRSGATTNYYYPNPLSPFDAGDNLYYPLAAVTAAFDQRGPGYRRLVNGKLDIGAYQVQDHEELAPTLDFQASEYFTNAFAGACHATVDVTVSAYGQPAPKLVCLVDGQAITFPYDFPVGTNVVTCTASNTAGIVTRSFSVTVRDVQSPEIVCPDRLVVATTPGATSVPVSFQVDANDNCGTATVNCVPPSGSSFPLGTNVVTCTAIDGAGNRSTCNFTVTVVAGCSPLATVRNANDSGPGSLRQALADVCNDGVIEFDPRLNGSTLLLTSGELVLRANATILGPGATNLTISGNGSSRVFSINSGVTGVLAGLTIANGAGGIHNLGTLAVSNCAVSGNFAFDEGGGIRNVGTLALLNSTISGNESAGDEGGGGLHNRGTVRIENSTISGNRAPGSGFGPTGRGGGLYNLSGSMTLHQSTVAGNSANSRGDGIFLRAGTLAVSHTLLSNVGENYATVGGSVSNGGFNLASDASAAAFASNAGNLQLGALAFNGGPTRTHALLAGSPAIDAGATDTLPNAWQIADVSTNVGSGSLNLTRTLTPEQKALSTNSGWHYTIVSRLVEGSGGGSGPAHYMIHGNGTRRFFVAWDTNAAGQLVATLGGGITTNLTADAEATNYHTHELIYNPATRQATYRFDGSDIFTWAGLNDANQNGIVQWGSASSNGRGRMNYHHVRFDISGLGTVAEYFAGHQDSPVMAPDPTHQNWTVHLPVAPGAVTNTTVSPDSVALSSHLSADVAFSFDQRGPGYPRLVGSAMDIGAFEVQAPAVPLSFGPIEWTPFGPVLRVQGAPNEALFIQWNEGLNPAGWQWLTGGTTDETGWLNYTDTTTAGQPQRFYRATPP